MRSTHNTPIRSKALTVPARDNAMLSTSLPEMLHFGGMRRASSSTTNPFIIGVAGGTASGKTSVCRKIIDRLKTHRLAIISQDSFYRPLTAEERENVGEYNFDHPDAFDWDLIIDTVHKLRGGSSKPVQIPKYNFTTHSREVETTPVYGADIILFEGILVFHDKRLRSCFDMKLFVDTDADTRLARRIIRDIRERGRDLYGVLSQYEKTVKPSFEEYCHPSKKFADVIIPRGADNEVAINLIVQHIRTQLDSKDESHFRKEFIE